MVFNLIRDIAYLILLTFSLLLRKEQQTISMGQREGSHYTVYGPHTFSVTLFYNFAPNDGYTIFWPHLSWKILFWSDFVFLNARLTVILLGSPQHWTEKTLTLPLTFKMDLKIQCHWVSGTRYSRLWAFGSPHILSVLKHSIYSQDTLVRISFDAPKCFPHRWSLNFLHYCPCIGSSHLSNPCA